MKKLIEAVCWKPFLLALTVSGGFVFGGEPDPALRAQAVSAKIANHPLSPILETAYRVRENVAQIKDYSCVFVKRERIEGKLGEYEYLSMKVRHEPFSVYTKFLGPESAKGKEALYVAGRNNGQLLAHGTGFQKLAGTLSLDPRGSWAMKGNRYPLTEAGMLNLIDRLTHGMEQDLSHLECDVHTFSSKIDGRACTGIQIIHPHPRKHFQYFLARFYIDDQLQLPVRSEVYDWPEKSGQPPVLMGEYTFTQLKLNPGFTDLDFDTKNPAYSYP